jgi:glycosidase
VEADYGQTHLFINEVAHETVPITIFFDPQTTGVAAAEVFTNLNRRERATMDADHDGVQDGIKGPDGNRITAGDDNNYYKVYPLQLVQGGYQLTLAATKCGTYRLTARYRLNGDAPGTFRWYGDETNASGLRKRDFAIVVTPSPARSLQLYEVNPLTMTATGIAPNQRGSFADLAGGLPPGSVPRFSFSYMKQLGYNTVWLQPIHPRGIDGRAIDPATNRPYVLGSPYAVKNFFSVMPLMARDFTPGQTAASNDTPAGRTQALKEFVTFVRAADTAGVNILVDAPFNHTAPDLELSSFGLGLCNNNPACNDLTEIRSIEARFFSRAGGYDMRGHDAASIALAPDRSDFGKWTDVFDIYFGRYASLVANSGQSQNYMNEGDWFDYSIGDENSSGQGNGHFDGITQSVWRYFGDYIQFWLTQTAYPENSEGTSLDSQAGIDGLRADFGQGLPPQCWEYIINRTRTRKWNFIFMAESLDGGPVTYRSARQFDVLNENLIYDLHHAMNTSDYRRIFEARRNAYGDALVLLNTSSHDEDTYRDPFEALLRFAVNSAMFGVSMLFPGQELGLRGTIVPPGDSNGSLIPFGYELYDRPFFGKPVPAFKAFNSLMPLWRELADGNSDSVRLLNLYSSIGTARASSPALRSHNRVYLNLQNTAPHEQIFSVAKFAHRNADPNSSDVVFVFVNLATGSDAETPAGDWFNVEVDADHDGKNDFGIRPDRLYNVRNIAAYTGVDAHRREKLQWPSHRLGSDLLKNGIFVRLNRLPADSQGWAQDPWEPQYLKLFDMTR